MNLVRFNCGCIGFAPTEENVKALILVACDCDSDDKYGLSWYDMSDKTYKPIEDPEEIGQHILKLQSLISDGYRFREIKRLLS